jgi:hypothetical protein
MNVNLQFKTLQPVLLRGDLGINQRKFEESPCGGLSDCYPYTNPPPCVNEFGGGGGGDCEPNCVAVPLPCPIVPDFCYWCSEYYGASISAGLFGESGPSIAFVVDEKGEIQPFDSPFKATLSLQVFNIMAAAIFHDLDGK